MNKYTEAEKELAELLGWREVVEDVAGYLTGSNKGRPLTQLPKWSRSKFSAAFLAKEFEISDVSEPYNIVQAIISKLKVESKLNKA